MTTTPQFPPATGVNHTTVILNATEILITFGRTRLAIVNQDGVAATEAYVEWLHTASLSPTAAMQLYHKLGESLMGYAQAYGTIPEDKAYNARAQPSDPERTTQ